MCKNAAASSLFLGSTHACPSVVEGIFQKIIIAIKIALVPHTFHEYCHYPIKGQIFFPLPLNPDGLVNLLITNKSAEMRLSVFIGRVIKGNGAFFTFLTGIVILMSSAAI